MNRSLRFPPLPHPETTRDVFPGLLTQGVGSSESLRLIPSVAVNHLGV